MRGYVAFGLGALGGVLIGGAVWWYASRKLDQSFAQGSDQLARDMGMGSDQLRAELMAGRTQLKRQVTAQIQSQVPAAIDRQLAVYGITPALVSNVERVLSYGERVGVI